MELGIIGTSIWQQNMALLECLTIGRDIRDEKLKELKKALDLDELIYVATCNRVELIYATSGKYKGDHLLHRMVDFFFNNGSEIKFFPNDFYHYTRKDAVTHLFRTISSLESLVIGETQISCQFRKAYNDAWDTNLVGPHLKRLADEALIVARKVKRETALVNGSLSMAALVSEEIRSHLSSKNNPVIALVGSGEMTVKIARYIKDNNLGQMLFVNRTIDKVAELAKTFSGQTISLDDFVSNPPKVEAIVSATAARTAIFEKDFLEKTVNEDSKLLCIDLAIPRDFSLDFVGDERISLIDIPYLKSKGNGNLRQRFVEASKANAIVRSAVDTYLANSIHVTIKPIFHDSHKESIELAHRALSDLFKKKVTGLDEEEKMAITRLVEKLVSHSSFQPAKIISDQLVRSSKRLTLDDITDIQKAAV